MKETAQNPVHPNIQSEGPRGLSAMGLCSIPRPRPVSLWWQPHPHLTLKALLQEDGTKGVEVIGLGAAGPGRTTAQCAHRASEGSPSTREGRSYRPETLSRTKGERMEAEVTVLTWWS